MAVHTFAGNACRGATWVALHNGGGVGWGEVINGCFGLVLDGTADAERRARAMLQWDVTNGMARRCWSENANARVGITEAMRANAKLNVTLPSFAPDDLLASLNFKTAK
ncbi:Urocanate hydratase [Perkinsus olseni]|nr:Urocanate hydratase [Perkinsus olseni]